MLLLQRTIRPIAATSVIKCIFILSFLAKTYALRPMPQVGLTLLVREGRRGFPLEEDQAASGLTNKVRLETANGLPPLFGCVPSRRSRRHGVKERRHSQSAREAPYALLPV